MGLRMVLSHRHANAPARPAGDWPEKLNAAFAAYAKIRTHALTDLRRAFRFSSPSHRPCNDPSPSVPEKDLN